MKNYNYGHLDSENKLVYADIIIIVDNKVYINPSKEIYLKAGEKLIIDKMPTEKPPEGKYWSPTSNYTQNDTEIHRVYELLDINIPTPVARVFSKLSLELVLFKKGLLSAVDQFIDSQTIVNDLGQSIPLRRLYDTALNFSEDNEYFKNFKDTLQKELSITDEQIEEILSNSVYKP